MPSAIRHKPLPTLVMLAVAFGVLCRVAQYAADTSLWHDEAYVALIAAKGSFLELLGPLDWNEAAPPGFLAAEKLALLALGRSELALRLLPLLAGTAGVIAFAVLARAVSGARPAWLWAVVFLAASEKLIVQSNEAKQFTLDLLLAVTLSGLALASLRRDRPAAWIAAWGALGAVGLWLSYASAFVLAGTGLVLAAGGWRRWPRTTWASFAPVCAAILVSFAFLLGPIRAQQTSGLTGYWSAAFPPLDGAPGLALWSGRAALGFCNYFWQPLGAAVAGLIALGAAQCWHTGRRRELALLVAPVGCALAASFLHRWPFGGNQHMVFAAPAVLILAAEGIEPAGRRLRAWRPWAAPIALAALLLPGVAPAVYHLAVPRQRHELRPVIAFVEAHRAPDDTVLVFCPAEFEFYTGRDTRGAPADPAPDRPVWVVTGRRAHDPPLNQELLDALAARRERWNAIETYGAAAYRFGPETGSRAAARTSP